MRKFQQNIFRNAHPQAESEVVKMQAQQNAGLIKDVVYYKQANRELTRTLKETQQQQARTPSAMDSGTPLEIRNAALAKENAKLKTQYEHMKNFLATHVAQGGTVVPIPSSREYKNSSQAGNAQPRASSQVAKPSKRYSRVFGTDMSVHVQTKQPSPGAHSNSI